MYQLIEKFFEKIRNGGIEVYNEFSFQHELGIFLRAQMPEKKVQFERNVSYFKLDKADFVKKEIDIVIFSAESLECVIELKYPRNGQVPETMFSFCKDIAFLEQLALSGFMVPIDSLPEWLQPFSLALPLTYGIEIFKGIMLKGYGIVDLWGEFLAIIAFSLFFLILSTVASREG